MYLGLFSFGGGEIFIVLIAVLLLFGANKIPELARMLGKGMNEFKRATDDIKREFKEGTDEFKKDLDDSKKEIDSHIHDITDTVTEEDDYDPYMGLEEDEDDELYEAPAEDEESTEPEKKETEPENLAQPRPKKNKSSEEESN
ncbi:Sec-independent protein translocase subunit TatA/TatB [Labilibacter marinus]|uniref:Sec-independent protein translocase subunit TatA/TatB n=1 Tax=Labilibacter marinus TaxID=1477105 RepID=UPI0008301010|nr:twin-arginine translocase TatA/TatE family subunit [Labilibacter marinus]